MSAIVYKLSLETKAAIALRERMAEALDDDPEATRDTIEGATDLHELIERAAKELRVAHGLASGLKSVMDQMEERMARYNRRAEKIHNAIEAAMIAGEIQKLELPFATMSISAGGQPRTIITDESAIPEAFLKHPPPVPDKQAIKAAILGGSTIPGVELSNPAPHLTMRTK